MKRIRIYPYHFRVSACANIVDNLIDRGCNAVRVYPDRNYRPKPNDLVINWGCSHEPSWKNPLQYNYSIINHWDNIQNAVDKIKSFARFKAVGVTCPDVTVASEKAKLWLSQGLMVVGRKSVMGRAGHGIVLMKTPVEFEECPLYTVYKPKKKEFRVHVFGDKIIDYQQKRKKKNWNQTSNSQIRTHDNGWVFCREGIFLPDDSRTESIKAVKALGLVFGGVDVIWNEKENKSYILEVNSAPGIEGTTIRKYSDEIYRLAQ